MPKPTVSATRKLSAGYTLIELLVSTTIVMLVVSGGLVSYRRFDDKQKLVSASRQIESSLRDVQKRAQSGQKPETGCTQLSGWRFTKGTSYQAGTYSLHPECAPEGTLPGTTYTLPAGVTINESSVSILFQVLSGKADAPKTINLVTQQGNQRLSVNQSGSIENLGEIEQ